MIVSSEQRAEALAKLAAFFAGRADGEELLWTRIEAETGVPMGMPGRELARRALRRLKRPYEALVGEGIRLSSAGSTMTIMRHRFVRVDNAVRRADKTRAHLVERHFDEMPQNVRAKMTVLASFFGAIRTMAKDNAPRVLTVEVDPKV